MKSRLPLRSIIAAFLALLAACASSPRLAEGEQELRVVALENVRNYDPTSGALLAGAPTEPVQGVRCVLRNDKGTWTVMAPDTARVARSLEPLQVECSKEGFRTVTGAIRCTSPKEQERGVEAGVIANTVLLVGGMAAALGGGIVILPGAFLLPAGTVAIGRTTLPGDADVCSYASVMPFMIREGSAADAIGAMLPGAAGPYRVAPSR